MKWALGFFIRIVFWAFLWTDTCSGIRIYPSRGRIFILPFNNEVEPSSSNWLVPARLSTFSQFDSNVLDHLDTVSFPTSIKPEQSLPSSGLSNMTDLPRRQDSPRWSSRIMQIFQKRISSRRSSHRVSIHSSGSDSSSVSVPFSLAGLDPSPTPSSSVRIPISEATSLHNPPHFSTLQPLPLPLQQQTEVGEKEEESGEEEKKKKGSVKNVLILLSDTGGGHRAAALAIQDALLLHQHSQSQPPSHSHSLSQSNIQSDIHPCHSHSDSFNSSPVSFNITILDIWSDHGMYPFTRLSGMYRWLAARPLLWFAFYQFGRFPLSRGLTELWSSVCCYDRFKRVIESYRPDVVVSVHPLCNHMPVRIVKRMNEKMKRESVKGMSTPSLTPSSSPAASTTTAATASASAGIPFVTVVTDLGTAHPTWFNRNVDLCIVPSPEVRQIALNNGLKMDKIRLIGLPVRRPFWTSEVRSKAYIRAELGLLPDVPTVLVMGGGDGVGDLRRLTSCLCRSFINRWSNHSTSSALSSASAASPATTSSLRSSPPSSTPPSSPPPSASPLVQVVVICGNNQKVKDALTSDRHNSCPNGHGDGLVSVVPVGFVDNVHEWMAASDCIVSKAGPGTINEAALRGLPVVLSSYLPGQESGNVPYVVDKGFGCYDGTAPEVICRRVVDIMTDVPLRVQLSAAARTACNPNATRDIVDAIVSLMH